jgi:membrane protease YdiL (CAAX protease family)
LSETAPEHGRWWRGFLGLAIVDTIVAALVIALVASGVWGWHTLTERRSRPRAGEAVRIGVTVVANPQQPDEVQIGTVATDSRPSVPASSLETCGHAVGGALVAQLTEAAVALFVGLMAMRQMAGAGVLGARLEPVLSARSAVALGVFYLVAVKVRVSIVRTAIEAFGHVDLSARATEEGVASAFMSLEWSGRVLLALTVAVLGPVAEEVLFRGVILPRLAPWMGATWAIVASSVVFAVLHEGAGSEPFSIRTLDVFVVAMVLGWARLRSGSLAAPIIMHVGTNTLSLLVFG